MAFDSIQLPSDGGGKHLATRISTGQGPAGVDVHLEVDVVVPENSVGYVVASQPLSALPQVLTDVFTSTIALQRLFLANDTDTDIQIEFTDRSGTPIALIPTTVLPARAFWNFDLGGLELTNGLKWRSLSAGVNGAVVGYVAA